MKTEAGELFRFRFLTEIRFGVGVRNKIGEYLSELNSRRIALVVDNNAVESEPGRELLSRIRKSGKVLKLDGPNGEPEISELEALRKEASTFSPDAVIGVGGGSTLDMAKGLAAILPNSMPAAEYQGFDKLENPALPSVLVPTLFGAGAEVTSSAVMINREKKTKGGINGRFVFPRMAVIDPELGLGAPVHVMGATALDALVHCIEGYVAKCATPLSMMFSRQASLLILPALFKLADNTASVQALEDIAFASLLAVAGLMHSESGVCGAISYPLGVHHDVPHGLAGGLVMPKAIEFNVDRGCELYADLLPGTYTPRLAGKKLSESIRELIGAFKLPSLSAFGVGEENIPKLAEEVFGFKAILNMNPVKVDSPDILSELIRAAL